LKDGAIELLQKFDWKGVIAIHLKRIGVDSKTKSLHKAKFMINLKAKENHMNEFLALVELDKLIKERWNKDGIYFKINK